MTGKKRELRFNKEAGFLGSKDHLQLGNLCKFCKDASGAEPYIEVALILEVYTDSLDHVKLLVNTRIATFVWKGGVGPAGRCHMKPGDLVVTDPGDIGLLLSLTAYILPRMPSIDKVERVWMATVLWGTPSESIYANKDDLGYRDVRVSRIPKHYLSLCLSAPERRCQS